MLLKDVNSPAPDREAPKDPTKETILQTARLFVRNLAFSCTDADLLELFSPFGEISQVSSVFFVQLFHSKMIRYMGTSDSLR